MQCKILNFKKLNIIVFIFLLLLVSGLKSEAQMPRPPQYVLISFEGGYDFNIWNLTREWSQQYKTPITYFLSGVYFISKDKRNEIYQLPQIENSADTPLHFNFSHEKAALNIAERIKQVHLNLQYSPTQFEFASHLVGHWDGKEWDAAQWSAELNFFDKFLREVFQLHPIKKILNSNGYLSKDDDWSLDWPSDIKNAIQGNRAPHLSQNTHLYEELIRRKYLYDSSQVGTMEQWPCWYHLNQENPPAIEKRCEHVGSDHLQNPGLWVFSIPQIPIAMMNSKKTPHALAMDYNFYLFDGETQDLKRASQLSKRYYDSLLQYFLNNYNQSRAPVLIGNHFSSWNKGAYLLAVQQFMIDICKSDLPEVQCLTYQTFVQKMNESVINQSFVSWSQNEFQKPEKKFTTEFFPQRDVEFFKEKLLDYNSKD